MFSPQAAGRETDQIESTRPPPLPFALPAWDSTKPLRPRSITQLFAGVGMFVGAIWLALEDDAFRHFEALTASPIAGWVTGRHGAVTSHDLVYFALGTRRAFGIEITNECTSALLLIPLLVMMGSFTVFSRVPLRRELFALAVGAALMFVVNILRVAGIAWSTWKWGLDPGYKYSHVFVGSAFSLVGFVGAMLLALWVLVRTERIKQAAVKLRRAFWVATAPASHRAESDARGVSRGRAPSHRYHRHR
jgi:exosortase/archaeosortase family protein